MPYPTPPVARPPDVRLSDIGPLIRPARGRSQSRAPPAGCRTVLYEQITLGGILLIAVGGDAWSRLRTT